MLWVCDDGHPAITYQSRDCPVCQEMKVVEDITKENELLQEELDNTKGELADADGEIAKLTDKLESLKENGVVNKKIS